MRNRQKTTLSYVPLSPQEKIGTLEKLKEKTIFEDYMYRRLLFVVGIAFGLVSIWVTYSIERLANYTHVGISMNVLSGLLFLFGAMRNLHQRECKISKSIEFSSKEQDSHAELLDSVQKMKESMSIERGGFVQNKLNEIHSTLAPKSATKVEKWLRLNDLIESGAMIMLNWFPFVLTAASRFVWANSEVYELVFPFILGGYSLVSEYLLILIGENYHEINVLYKVLNESMTQ